MSNRTVGPGDLFFFKGNLGDVLYIVLYPCDREVNAWRIYNLNTGLIEWDRELIMLANNGRWRKLA
jgi:hypothetical protein